MNDYEIVTDSSCDIMPELLQLWGVCYASLTVKFDGDEESFSNYDMPFPEFYDKMRKGRVARTSAVNIESFKQVFEPIVKAGKDVLYIGFSSGMSTTVNSGTIAAAELAELYPERKIVTVDTLAASAGLGLLVYLAVQTKKRGATLEETAKFVEDTRLQICHWVTVDDLVYLKRGGRVSATAAFVSGVLNIKPVLRVDNDGRLETMFKARGRRAALKTMADQYEKYASDPEHGTVFISHGDSPEDAHVLGQMLAERFGVKAELISYIGPVIGSHAGPGTVSLFFVGKER